MFGGGKAKKELEDLQKQLAESRDALAQRQAQLDKEVARIEEIERQKADIERQKVDAHRDCEELQAQRDVQRTEIDALREAAAASEAHLKHDREAEHAAVERLSSELDAAQSRLDGVESALAGAIKEGSVAKAQLAESEAAASAQEQRAAELQRRYESQAARIRDEDRERSSRQHFLDVAIGECEFASAFAYSVAVQLRSRGEPRSTDVCSPPSQRPAFRNTSFLLPGGAGVAEDVLVLTAYVHVADSLASGSGGDSAVVPRVLGEATVPLTELSVSEDGACSRRVVRSVAFQRKVAGGGAVEEPSASGGAAGKNLTVGRVTVSLQAKVLTPAEVSGSAPSQVEGKVPLPATFPSLDRSLWPAQPFRRHLRVLVHRAGSLPFAPAGGHATVRVACRLLRADGQILHESATADMPVPGAGQDGVVEGDISTEVAFGQELALPLPTGQSEVANVQVALELVSASGGGSVASASLLDLHVRPESLPALCPLHMLARPSHAATPVPSNARPRPSLLLSLTREPDEDAVGGAGGGTAYCTELRLHGVPVGRPLPEVVDGPLLAVCLADGVAGSSIPAEAAALRIPVAVYYYDQRLDLASFIDAHFRSSAGSAAPRFFVSPIARRSRTPNWGQFVLKFAPSAASLSHLSLLLYETSGPRSDPDSPLGAVLLGLATLDAAALVGDNAGQPMQRSFQPDLRLLEAPGSAPSLDVEVRVWPRRRPGEAAASGEEYPSRSAATRPAQQLQQQQQPRPSVGPGFPAGPIAAVAPAAPLALVGSAGAALQHEAQEIRLNHELSVQLAKEFNMRAAALKRAGEEIVELRRQVQLLRSENARLQSQLDDEMRLVEDVRRKPYPNGLDSLSAPELATRLQRALEKYRDERAKGVELGHRLEEASKELSRGRGLQRSLDELERAHMEQNRELQRLQEENRKMDTYRHTTKTQEKVIAKLENILESSLQEVQKAQRVQVDVERMKTENMRLRERCAQLVARVGKPEGRGGGDGMPDVEELRRHLMQKDDEVARLQGLVRDMQRSAAQQSEAALRSSPELGRERQRLEDQEALRMEWEQRCQAAEQRLQMLQHQLTDSSKRYGAEISSLRVDIAKRDARILELEFLMREGAKT